ncbi:MAG: nucleotidyltransferase domain-containing protein [Syntrophaceae bacterium]|nr:nucleotidyltransferase domain-containing protein [Syntrophaceae bacterium]
MAIKPLREINDQQKEKIVEVVKELLDRHKEIKFALLYGSFVNPDIQGKYGDIDIGLYIEPDQLNTYTYILESNIEAEAYSLLSSKGLNIVPVEAVLLNHAPIFFVSKLLKGRYLILKEDEEALTNFIEEVGEKAMDNYHLRIESIGELVGETYVESG